MSTVRKGRYAVGHKERNSVDAGRAQAYTESREHGVEALLAFHGLGSWSNCRRRRRL
jgi:hypothetical protein